MFFLPPKAAVIICTSVAAAVAVMGTMLLKTHHDHNLHLSSSPPPLLLTFLLHSSSDALSSWLTPPFLYLLVNAIIISILASSKLQYSKTAASSSPAADDVSLSGYGGFSETEVSRSSGLAEGGQLEEPPVDGQKATERDEDHAPASSVVPHIGWDDRHRRDMAATAADDEYSGGGGLTREEDREAKPPVSSRFVPRKSALPPPPPNGSATNFTHRSKGGGGSKAAAAGLGISKSGRRDETLESTWKMITEGRRVPLTRHLKKSDTWNTGHVAVPSSAAGKVMKKSETFRDAGKSGGRKNEMGATTSDTVGRAVKKREPSLGQEELNRRVEAFIKNFNEEMRLQRQESLNRYRELLRAGGVVSF